jgi:hypothetical protein
MSQPFIKFISHTTGYLVFIGLIIAETLRVGYDFSSKKFSTIFPQYVGIFSNYASNQSLSYRFTNPDFVLRGTNMSYLEWIIFFWIMGQYYMFET